MLHISAELRFCGTWIAAEPVELDVFLDAYVPHRAKT